MNCLVRLMLIVLLGGMFMSCGAGKQTRGSLWAKMYEERPNAILVMPPINKTEHVAAKDFFYSSIAAPLVDRGYYVFSPYLTLDLLQQESAGDAEPFLEGTLAPFRKVLNADAVLFTVIKRWQKDILSSSIRVEVEYIMRSAKTDQELFRRNADVTVDTSIDSGMGLLSMVVNAIATATTSKIVGARRANYFLLKDMPSGKYAPDHGKDQKQLVSSADISNVTVR